MMLTALLSVFLCLLSASVLGHDAVKVVVQEDSDAILPCSPSTKGNLVGAVFDWTKDPRRDDPRKDVVLYDSGTIKPGAEEFRGRVSHFMDELKNGNASIIIRNAKIKDSGNYTCFFPHLQPEETFHIELVVEPVPKDRYGQFQGASPKPNIRILNGTKDGVLVECEVEDASPKPEVEFYNHAGNILPAEEPQVSEGGRRYTVTLITTVTKTDYIRCVAKQKEIHHETKSVETYVPVHDTCSKVDVTGWIGGFFVGVFSLAAVQALLVATKCMRIQCTKESSAPTDVPQHYKPVPNGNGQVAEPSAATDVPRHNAPVCNGFHQTKSSPNNHLTDPPESVEPLQPV